MAKYGEMTKRGALLHGVPCGVPKMDYPKTHVQIKLFINMMNHSQMYVPSFILSLPALRLSQFDAVHGLTAILKFNIKPLTTSNAGFYP